MKRVVDLWKKMEQEGKKPGGAFATRILNAITLSMKSEDEAQRINEASEMDGFTLGSIRASLYEQGRDGNQFKGWPDSKNSKTGNPVEEALTYIENLAFGK